MEPIPPVARLSATGFRHQLLSGRTRPCVFACEAEDGEHAGEYVVKLRTRMELEARGAVRELLASLIATALGLDVPEPAIVEIEPELADGILQVDVSGDVRNSAGLNFGCRYLSGGYTAWQPRQQVPQQLLERAFEVFSFDALIDNPDRRPRPSNLLTDGERIVVIDHESAFSFLLAVPPPEEPWNLTALHYLTGNVFYPSLRSMLVSGERIRAAIAALTPETCTSIEAAMPKEWRGKDSTAIREHLEIITSDADDFISAVKQLLQ